MPKSKWVRSCREESRLTEGSYTCNVRLSFGVWRVEVWFLDPVTEKYSVIFGGVTFPTRGAGQDRAELVIRNHKRGLKA